MRDDGALTYPYMVLAVLTFLYNFYLLINIYIKIKIYMKKIIRLTESDLHKIIKNSVKRIINELTIAGHSSGDQGNTMTMGGNFGRSSSSETVDLLEPFLQKLADNGYGEIVDKIDPICQNSKSLFEIEINIDSQYDETTDYGTEDSPVISAEAGKGYGQLKQFLKGLSRNQRIAEILIRTLDEVIDEKYQK
jgi:hypothetical protein